MADLKICSSFDLCKRSAYILFGLVLVLIIKINKMLISDGINHGKLQSIIVGELKKAGLKHRLKKIILKSVKDHKTVFGAPLLKVPSCSVICCGSTLSVPIVVTEMSSVLRSNAHVEGLSRKAGSQNRQKDIKRLLDAGGCVSEGHHPIDVGSVLKLYLRCLPEPLISAEVQDAREADSVASDADNEDGKAALVTNEGWADSVAKILGSSKPKNKKTVLSRAKKHSEVIDETGEKKPVLKKEVEPVTTEPPAKKIKYEKPSIRVKLNIQEKDRERVFAKIARKGVVQLYNAVRNHQKSLESKREKILKKFDKRAFLDKLMGQSKSNIEIKDEDKPKWSALRDDFMMGAKMKDWDKESVDE